LARRNQLIREDGNLRVGRKASMIQMLIVDDGPGCERWMINLQAGLAAI
jgi:hypothetical protein